MLLKKLLDYIFIPNGRCPLCYRVLFFTDEFICDHCLKNLKEISGRRCKKCGKKITDIMNYCSQCLKNDYSFDKGFSIYHYDANMRKIIHQIKFSNNPALAEYMGERLGKALIKCEWISEVDLIIPVPLHPNRLNTRGYNQSSMISQGIINAFKDDSRLKNIIIDEESVIRYKDTPHQLELNRVERIENVKNAFKVVDKEKLHGRVVLLIDDVFTTGATLESCSKTLLKGGAKKVYFSTLAMVDDNIFNQ